jgi:hypothetical protein
VARDFPGFAAKPAALLDLFVRIAARETNYKFLFGFAILASLPIG